MMGCEGDDENILFSLLCRYLSKYSATKLTHISIVKLFKTVTKYWLPLLVLPRLNAP